MSYQMPAGVNTGPSPKLAQDALDFYLKYVKNFGPGHDEFDPVKADRHGPFYDIGPSADAGGDFTQWVWHHATPVDDILVVAMMLAILFTLSAMCMFAVQTSRNLTKQRLERQRLADQAEHAAHVAHEEQVFQAPLPANDVLLPNEVPLQNDVSLQTDMPLQHVNTPGTMLANMKMLAAATSELQFQIDFAADMEAKQQLYERTTKAQFAENNKYVYDKCLAFIEEKTGEHEQMRGFVFFDCMNPGASFEEFEDDEKVNHAKQDKFDRDRDECMKNYFKSASANYDAYIRAAAKRNTLNRAMIADLEMRSAAVLARMLPQRGV